MPLLLLYFLTVANALLADKPKATDGRKDLSIDKR